MSLELCNSCTRILSYLVSKREVRTEGAIHEKYKQLRTSPQACRLCAVLCARSSDHPRNQILFTYIHWVIMERFFAGRYNLHIQYAVPGSRYMQMQTFVLAKRLENQGLLKSDFDVHTLSRRSVAFLRRKLEECLTTHIRCCEAYVAGDDFYPIRLLEVGETGDPRVRLVDTMNIEQQPYCTLSHCWGDVQLMKLTHNSEHSLRAGVLLEKLPKTFSQAVDICRQLNMAYVWIDSLCIFQDKDDRRDWHTQSSCMGNIYSSAAFNIAASSATNSTVGLQFDRNLLKVEPFTFTFPEKRGKGTTVAPHGRYDLEPIDEYELEVNEGPLNKRGWVLQERFLSKRVMHFTSSGIFWECLTNLSSDIHPKTLPPEFGSARINHLELRNLMRNNIGDGQAWNNGLYRAWSRLLQTYSSRALSFDTDILVAINGLAERLALITGDTLVCGLWKQYFIPQLLWFGFCNMHKRCHGPWLSPTWSWANYISKVEMTGHILCDCSKDLATVEDLSYSKLTSGQIMQASLILQGKLVHALLETSDVTSPMNDGLLMFKPSGKRGTVFAVFLDDVLAKPFIGDVTCMAIREDTCKLGLYSGYYSGKYSGGVLVLQQQTSEPATYRRIGIMLLEENSWNLYRSQESSEAYSITLI